MILNNVLDNHETNLVLSRDSKPRGTKRQQSDGQADQETTRSSNEKTKHNTHLHSLQRRQLCELTWIRKEESHSPLLEARGVATQVVSEQGRVSTADTGPAATINTSVWYRRWRGKRGSTSSGQVTVSVRDCH